MPIDIFCEACQKKLRVPDTAAGKRIKCPKCQGVLSVPSAEAAAPTAPQASSHIPTPSKMAASKSSAAISVPTPTPTPTPKVTPGSKIVAKPKAENWFVQTEEGEQYGPVTREELDAWYAEGRITLETQLLLEGGSQWQWASDVFPELNNSAAAPAADTAAGGFPAFGEMAASSSAATSGTGEFNFGATPSKGGTVAKKGKKGRSGGSKGGTGEVGDKSKVVAGLLGIFLGAWGVHNFYLGFTQKGVIQIVVTIFTCGVGGIWGLIEGIMILTGSIKLDADGNRLKD